jgi:hypothetical protein
MLLPFGNPDPTDSASPAGPATCGGERFASCLQLPNLGSKCLVLRDAPPRLSRRQIPIVPPPVQSDLLGLVERAHQKPNPDGEKLYLSQRHADIPGNDEPFVEHAVEHVNQSGAARM